MTGTSFYLLSQESFPPGLTQVFTPNLGSTYLLSTNQATMIAMSTKKSFISVPLPLHWLSPHPVFPGPPSHGVLAFSLIRYERSSSRFYWSTAKSVPGAWLTRVRPNRPCFQG